MKKYTIITADGADHTVYADSMEVACVEWYYSEEGYSQAYEYFLQESDIQKRKFLYLVKKMAQSHFLCDAGFRS